MMGGPKATCYTGRVRLPPLLLFVAIAFVCHFALAESIIFPPPAPSPLLQQGNARVVLVGDSITGQSRNHPAGYAHQMDWALQQAYPGCHPRIIALGGSGQGVQAWLNTEKRSRTESFALDVKGIDVKTELDQPADVLVIMLGMNDVLAPYVVDEPASLNQWAANYRALITALQSRLKPKTPRRRHCHALHGG
jgi:lysophospholipase L1-like esterase